MILEVCVESLGRAVAAERGGADRIELCSNLHAGGITPSLRLMHSLRKKLGIPIHVLIRPRAGDFVYSASEFETMKQEIRRAKDLGMDGIVLGVLDAKHQIDVPRTSELVKLAHPLPVTFHRAFDFCVNPVESLQAVIGTGARRLLTSGGKAKATDGLAMLARLVRAAGGRIDVMPAGGVRAGNVERIVGRSGARETHSSLGAHRSLGNGAPAGEFEARVRRVRRLLDALPC